MAKIYADVMLAKLARWLRMAGISVTDAPAIDDDALLRAVKRNKGVLLTSDERLCDRARKRQIRFVLVKQDRIESQMALVATALRKQIAAEPAEACPVCGSKLARITRKQAEGSVPKESYLRYRLFYFCRKCKKAYWHGTHWERIRSRLATARKIQKKMRARSGSPPAPRPR